MNPSLRAVQRLLIVNGGLVLLFGCVIGFGYLFFLLGRIELWPIPWTIEAQLPGSVKAWRMSHLEGIMNGALLWLTAAVLPAFELTAKSARRVALLLIVTAWTFPVASLFDAFFQDSRGLHFGAPLTNIVPFFLFYAGVLAVMWAIAEVTLNVWRQKVE